MSCLVDTQLCLWHTWDHKKQVLISQTVIDDMLGSEAPDAAISQLNKAAADFQAGLERLDNELSEFLGSVSVQPPEYYAELEKELLGKGFKFQ